MLDGRRSSTRGVYSSGYDPGRPPRFLRRVEMDMRFARRIDEVPPYLFVEISRKIAEKKAQGIDVISFGIGDPDIPTPSNVAGSVHEVFQGEWPDKVANQTPKTLPDSHRSSTGGGYSSRYDKVAN